VAKINARRGPLRSEGSVQKYVLSHCA